MDTKAGYGMGPRLANRVVTLLGSLDFPADKAPAGAEFEIFVFRPTVPGQRDEAPAVPQALDAWVAVCAKRGFVWRLGS